MCVVYVLQLMCGGQGTACGNPCAPFAVWFLRLMHSSWRVWWQASLPIELSCCLLKNLFFHVGFLENNLKQKKKCEKQNRKQIGRRSGAAQQSHGLKNFRCVVVQCSFLPNTCTFLQWWCYVPFSGTHAHFCSENVQ